MYFHVSQPVDCFNCFRWRREDARAATFLQRVNPHDVTAFLRRFREISRFVSALSTSLAIFGWGRCPRFLRTADYGMKKSTTIQQCAKLAHVEGLTRTRHFGAGESVAWLVYSPAFNIGEKVVDV